jgi:signal transduction histidine kinase
MCNFLFQPSEEAKVETEQNMTAYFAHELRNPLHAIDSTLKWMPEKLLEDAQNLIHAMNECTSFMSSIMNNLLDVWKMEDGKMILNKQPLSLKDYLQCVYTNLVASVRPGVKMSIVCDTGA